MAGDVQVHVSLASVAKTTIEIRYRGGIGVDVPWQPISKETRAGTCMFSALPTRVGHSQMLVEGRPELKYEISAVDSMAGLGRHSAEDVVVEGDWKILRVAHPQP